MDPLKALANTLRPYLPTKILSRCHQESGRHHLLDVTLLQTGVRLADPEIRDHGDRDSSANTLETESVDAGRHTISPVTKSGSRLTMQSRLTPSIDNLPPGVPST